jgi:hypothetical protein
MVFGGALVGPIIAGATVYTAVTAKNQADESKRQQEKALQVQKQANEVAKQQGEELIQAEKMAYNQANKKKVNVAGISDASQMAGKTGQSGTMLTGPMGIDPEELNLGQNTLLG